jgi:large subunit ribosomal protein L18e
MSEMRDRDGESVSWKVSPSGYISYSYLGLTVVSDMVSKVFHYRLFLSKTNRTPSSLSWIVQETSNTVDLPNKIIVSVGMITDDIRLTEVPKLTIAALCFTHAVKNHILNAGDEATHCSACCDMLSRWGCG